MDWDDLRYFLSVARKKSLLGAAHELGVNHSTVFRRINKFEESVGARLFERLADGYHLTGAGEELFLHAERVGSEIDMLQLRVAGKDFRPSGVVRLTAPDNLAYEFLPRYLASFSRRYPDIHFELSVGAQNLDLTRRETDLAIRATTSPPEHLIGRKVVSFRWAYYASRGYLRRHGTPQNEDSLHDHRLIGADGSAQRIPPLRRMDDQFSDNIVMRCSTLNAMSAMAASGYAIAVLPDDQMKRKLVRLFSVTPAFKSDVWLLTHPELRRTERIRLLMAHLYESFRNDPRISRITRYLGSE